MNYWEYPICGTRWKLFPARYVIRILILLHRGGASDITVMRSDCRDQRYEEVLLREHILCCTRFSTATLEVGGWIPDIRMPSGACGKPHQHGRTPGSFTELPSEPKIKVKTMMSTVNRRVHWSRVHMLCMYIVRYARGSSLINYVARSNKLGPVIF